MKRSTSVEMRDAMVISKLPFNPSSGGTIVFRSGMRLYTSHSYDTHAVQIYCNVLTEASDRLNATAVIDCCGHSGASGTIQKLRE